MMSYRTTHLVFHNFSASTLYPEFATASAKQGRAWFQRRVCETFEKGGLRDRTNQVFKKS